MINRLGSLCKGMEAALKKMRNTVVLAMVQKWWTFSDSFFFITTVNIMIVLVFIFSSRCTCFLSDAKKSFAERMELRIFSFWNAMDGGFQSDDQCCNSCEDVREAYRQKGWAIGDPEIIDQVFMIRPASGYWSFLSTTSAHFLLVGDKLNLVIMLLSPSCKYSKSWVCWVAVQKGGIFTENQRGGWWGM